MNPVKIVSTQPQDTIEIRWTPLNVCNFKCKYCFDGSNAGTYGQPKDLNLLLDNFDYLISQYKTVLNKKKVNLLISGGEPTLWAELPTFLEKIKDKHDVYLTLLSNGSRTLRWWQEHGKLIDNAHLSHHLEFGDITHIMNVADTLFEYNKKVTVKILMSSENWNKGLESIEFLKANSKHNWFIVTGEVNDVPSKQIFQEYTQEQKEYLSNTIKRKPSPIWFLKQMPLIINGRIRLVESKYYTEDGKCFDAKTNTYVNKNLNHFNNWECSIGLETVSIHWDGTIRGQCGSSIFGMNNYYNILDTDFTRNFEIFDKYTTCKYKDCFCTPETHTSKYAPKN